MLLCLAAAPFVAWGLAFVGHALLFVAGAVYYAVVLLWAFVLSLFGAQVCGGRAPGRTAGRPRAAPERLVTGG